MLSYCAGPGVASLVVGYLLTVLTWYTKHIEYRWVRPTRFNRQRREVCFVPKSSGKPVFVPWEDLQVWVIESQGVTEYGVQRLYGLGFGYSPPGNTDSVSLEFSTPSIPHALGTWEAVRAFMENEVHDLKEIHDPEGLQGNDPPWEGVHAFRKARKRLHEDYQKGEAGFWYFFGWYFYHILHFWSLPNRLVEWEVRKIQRMGKAELPKAMRDWSQPIPESEWARPSEELIHQSARVRELHRADPHRSIYEIYAQVSQEFDRERETCA